MKEEIKATMVGIDELGEVYSDRIITMKEVDSGLKNRNLFRRLSKTIESLKSKYILYVVKEAMLQEWEKPYYDNGVNVKEFIDINPHFVASEGGTGGYHHIENLCIWNNGFYSFNRFNLTTPAIRYGNQKKISVRKK